VLEHAHARDLVERLAAGQIGVVAQLDANAIGEPARRDLALHVLELVARQRDAGRLYAVVLGRPEDQRTPAAADVEEALALRQPQLPADMVELLRLRDVERIVALAEIRARIHHPR